MPQTPQYLVGSSRDIHRLVDGNGFVLCHVKVGCDKSVKAHSDGDVCLHALGEAIFLALGEGDLGDQFPTRSKDTLDMDSTRIMEKALSDASSRGYELSNVTVKVFLERPKLYAYKEEMRESLSRLLDLPKECVGLAFGTNEGLGPVGNGKAIECMATAMLKRKENATS